MKCKCTKYYGKKNNWIKIKNKIKFLFKFYLFDSYKYSYNRAQKCTS